MPKAKVGILRTSPATVFRDYHRVMNLAGYREVLEKAADTALKINIAFRIIMIHHERKVVLKIQRARRQRLLWHYGEMTRCVPRGTLALGGPPARCLVRTG